MALDSYQAHALERVIAGDNVFVCGPAGSGKTRLLRAIVASLRAAKTPFILAALTGIAATLLPRGATTLHRALGLKVGATSVADAAATFKWRRPLVEKLRAAEVIIVDEVSMASAETLALAEGMARRFSRRPSTPWGGRRVVVCGDFSQLLPVHERGRPPPRLAFETSTWHESAFVTCRLAGTHRQAEDAEYRALLAAARGGTLTPAHLAYLRTRVVAGDELAAARRRSLALFSRNAEADAYNAARLAELTTPAHTFAATLTVAARGKTALPSRAADAAKGFMTKAVRAPASLVLRKGARVMLLTNLKEAEGEPKPLANGHCGEVAGFDKDTGAPVVLFDNGRVWTAKRHTWEFDDPAWRGTFEQYPFVLAYGISVHKSQGLTVPAVTIRLTGREMFDAHMAYVALSRVARLTDLYIEGEPELAAFRRDARVDAFQRSAGSKRKAE